MLPQRVVGLDPSLNNWGVAKGVYDPDANHLDVQSLSVCSPIIPKGKQVRQNSKDLVAAHQLAHHVLEVIRGVQLVFVEVPVGSQSARAMASYGVCVGILGSLRAQGISFFEVTPLEVKMATVGSKTATKLEMIDWATGLYPDAPWPTQKKNGVSRIVQGKAEHMADAIGAIKAGVQLESFKQLSQIAFN